MDDFNYYNPINHVTAWDYCFVTSGKCFDDEWYDDNCAYCEYEAECTKAEKRVFTKED